MSASRLVNRNVVSTRGRTSMRLEPELWDALYEICRREDLPIGDLVRRIELAGHSGGRTSAVRVFILSYFRIAATEDGHLAAGHGTQQVAHTRRSSTPPFPMRVREPVPGPD